MKNKKYQLFCMLLSGSMLVTSPAVPVLASQGTAKVETRQQAAEDVDADEEWDNDALFQDYLTSLFYQAPEGVSLFSLDSTEKSTLNETEKKLYYDLKPLITEVAEGTRTSTTFTIDTSGYEELRFSSMPSSDDIAQVIDVPKVWKVLLEDMPYELYWHDKTRGISYSYSRCYESDENIAYVLAVNLSLAIDARYAETDNKFQMSTTTASMVERAKKAAANAKAIVNSCEALSDYEKLKAYKDRICELVTYNHAAAAASSFDTEEGGDPWQLIYVFDEDSDTNVVCEGYSKAFAYLCDLTEFSSPDIACYLVSGTLGGGTGSGGHMWNVVTMDDGCNYLVDVTNCDSGTIGAPDGLFLAALPGTMEGKYEYTRDLGNTVTYFYGNEIKNLYGTDENSILKLKPVTTYEQYTPGSAPVEDKDLSKADVTLSTDSFTYSGNKQQPTVTVLLDGTEVSNDNYDVSITSTDGDTTSAGTNAGTVTLTITAKSGSGYKGSTTKTYVIEKAVPEITDVTCTAAKIFTSHKPADLTYTCKARNGDKTVAGNITLTDLAFMSGTNTYHWKFTPSDTANYTEQTGTIRLTAADKAFMGITVSNTPSKAAYRHGDDIDLTGIVVTAVYDDGTTEAVELSKLSYDKKLQKGQTKLTVTYKAGGKDYTAEVTGFTVAAKELSDSMISFTTDENHGYTGTAITPDIVVKDGETTLTEGTDYKVSYANNTDAAAADSSKAPTVMVEGIGNYAKTAKKTFTIGKADASITLGNLAQTEGCVSAVTAVVSPASADAAATVEYLVTQDGKEIWTTEIPKTAGNYKVRAFLEAAKAGKNLHGYNSFAEAKAAGKFIEDTLMISKDSSGEGNSGSSSSGSETGGGATTPDEPDIPDTPDTPEVPTTPDEPDTPATPSTPGASTPTETNPGGGKTEADKNTGAAITIKTDSKGKKTITAAVTKTGTRSASGIKVSISAAEVSQITKAAGTKAVMITQKMVDKKGKTICSIMVNASDLKSGRKLKIFKYNTKTGEYTLCNNKDYKVSGKGSVSLTTKESGTYRLLNQSDAKAVSNRILASVKAASSSKTIKKGKKTTISLNKKKLNMANVSKITYSSSRSSVAKVDKKGKIIAKKAGKATIKAKVTLKNGKTKTVTMKVKVK